MKSKMIASRKTAAPAAVPAPPPAPPVAPEAAVPAPPAPAPVAPETYNSLDEALSAVNTESLAAMVKALVGGKDFANDKAAQFMIETLTNQLKSRPVEVEEGQAVTASFTTNESTMDVEEGSRTPEVAEAHGKQDDNTGVSRPSTTPMDKFAGDMSAASAAKKAEDTAAQLERTYLNSKTVTSVNSSRPVREAVEAIFVASRMMGEAAKVLAKQTAQEEAEAAAAAEKLKKSSRFGGLHIAAAE